MDSYQRIVQFMKLKGPVLPVQVAKELSTNSILASAMLSDLASQKQVKISSVKVGGSPLYFLPGQERLLEEFAHHLNEKDKRTYDFLQEKGVVKEDRADPLTRVSLRAIKDFAVPLEAEVKGVKHLFWKWYLLDDIVAKDLIMRFFVPKEEEGHVSPAPPSPAPLPPAEGPAQKPQAPVPSPKPKELPELSASVAETAQSQEDGPFKREQKREESGEHTGEPAKGDVMERAARAQREGFAANAKAGEHRVSAQSGIYNAEVQRGNHGATAHARGYDARQPEGRAEAPREA
ncbi:hypothetical protein COY95_05020, partial [Candidatus Woesearchaeota archaeon CG_4_10_14_0_8_um_filter_47_5]